MAVSGDIVQAWRDPRGVMRRHLAQGRREDRALAFLMGACVLIFVAQMPLLARLAEIDPAIPLDARLQSAFYAWVLFVPVFAYALAGAIYLIMRVFDARADGYKVRLGFFWTLLAIAPASLFYGLTQGFLGNAPGTAVAGAILVAGFFWILIQSLRETLRGDADV